MFVCMNAVKTSATQHMNVHAQQRLYPPVGWKNLWQSENTNMNPCKNVLLFIINNLKSYCDVEKRAADLNDATNITFNITINGISILQQ